VAANRLVKSGHEIVNVGIKKGEVAGVEILNGTPELENIDTVTLYVGPKNQEPYYDWLVNEVKPRRIIFNPGTENAELSMLARKVGIEFFTSLSSNHGVDWGWLVGAYRWSVFTGIGLGCSSIWRCTRNVWLDLE